MKNKSKRVFIKNIPIFVVFKLLGDIEPEESLETYIFRFIPEKYRRKAKNFFNSSVVKVRNIPDVVKYLCKKRKKKFTLDIREEIKQQFKTSMLENFFPNIEGFSENVLVKLKLTLFSFVISKFTLVCLNVLKEDSRDSWINKRFDTAGTSVKILLGSSLNSLMQICKRDITKFSQNQIFLFLETQFVQKDPVT